MRKVKVAVGGAVEKEAGRRFIDAWHRAERGEKLRERYLTFESWDTLVRVLTSKRMELLRYVRHHDVTSVRALAKALKRDYSNVHADVQFSPRPDFSTQRMEAFAPTTTRLKHGSRFKGYVPPRLLISASATSLTPLHANTRSPSRVGIMLRTTPPPEEMVEVWNFSVAESKRTSTFGSRRSRHTKQRR